MFDYLMRLYNENPNEINNFRLKLIGKLTELAYFTGHYLFAWLELPDVVNRVMWQEFAPADNPYAFEQNILIYTFRSIEVIERKLNQNTRVVSGLGQYLLPSAQELDNTVNISAYDTYSLILSRVHSIWYDLNNKTKNDWQGFNLSEILTRGHSNKLLGNLLIVQTTPDLRYVVGAIQLLGIQPVHDAFIPRISGAIDEHVLKVIQITYHATHIRKLHVHNQDLWQWFVNMFLEQTPQSEPTV